MSALTLSKLRRYRNLPRAAAFLCVLALGAAAASASAQTAPAFSQIFVFGDSLSDTGNVRAKMQSGFGVSYPGGDFNYSDGRFTNSRDTNPGSGTYVGVWHEQLAKSFLGMPIATPSSGGGNNYAFGGATTMDSSSDREVVNGITISVDNIGRQINQYLGSHTPDAAALYVVWGGGNDLFDDNGAANVTATAGRVNSLVQRLANAGARTFLVPNLPPLGAVPRYHGDPSAVAAFDKASSDYRRELNAQLDAAITTLAGQGITITVYRLDIWALFLRLTAEPKTNSFTNIDESARGNSGANPDNYLFWDDIHPTTAGHHAIAAEAFRVLSGQLMPSAKAENLSTRVAVGTDQNAGIGGFVISGTVPKKVIIRGLGPSLAAAGVTGFLVDPTLDLQTQTGTPIRSNDNWRQSTQVLEIMASGLQPPRDEEAAIVETLPPGSYTATLLGSMGTSGIGLIEVYDLDKAADSTLGNVSTRGFVGLENNVMIGGFVIGSGGDAIEVVRVLGPSLSTFGVTNPLLDPTVELHNGSGTLLAFNDDWKDTQPSAIKGALLPPSDDRECAIVAALPPGNYTAVVRGKGGATGMATVEAYRIP